MRWDRLCGDVDAFRTGPFVGKNIEGVERELHERFVEAERVVLGRLLERLDVDVPSVEVGVADTIGCFSAPRPITTAMGTVTAKRTLYRCGRKRAVVSTELRAGIVRRVLESAGGA